VKPKVLLILEDEDILNLVTYLLTGNNYEVVASKSLVTIESVKAINADLILFDYWLSDINGIDFCIALKADKATLKIPIIILSTTKGLEETVSICNASGFVEMPFDIDQLLEKVKEFA
jgi:DNA-binding response OmpR family regulator